MIEIDINRICEKVDISVIYKRGICNMLCHEGLEIWDIPIELIHIISKNAYHSFYLAKFLFLSMECRLSEIPSDLFKGIAYKNKKGTGIYEIRHLYEDIHWKGKKKIDGLLDNVGESSFGAYLLIQYLMLNRGYRVVDIPIKLLNNVLRDRFWSYELLAFFIDYDYEREIPVELMHVVESSDYSKDLHYMELDIEYWSDYVKLYRK